MSPVKNVEVLIFRGLRLSRHGAIRLRAGAILTNTRRLFAVYAACGACVCRVAAVVRRGIFSNDHREPVFIKAESLVIDGHAGTAGEISPFHSGEQ